MTGHQQPDSVEVWGRFLQMFTSCLLADNLTPILEKHGMLNLDPDQWYPLSRWMAVLDDIAAESDSMFDFVSVGMRIVDATELPPQILQMPFETLLMTLIPRGHNVAYRNGYQGYCNAEKVSDTHVVYRLNTPMPDDLSYGIFYGYVRRLIPKNWIFTVKYDEGTPRLDLGGEETVIHVAWTPLAA